MLFVTILWFCMVIYVIYDLWSEVISLAVRINLKLRLRIR